MNWNSLGDLPYEGLNIFRGTENYANATIIQDRNGGQYLAILRKVATPGFVQEAIAETLTEETEVPLRISNGTIALCICQPLRCDVRDYTIQNSNGYNPPIENTIYIQPLSPAIDA